MVVKWCVVCGLWFVVCGVWGWGGVEGSVDVAGDVAFEAASDFSHSVYRQGCNLRTRYFVDRPSRQ